MSVSNSCSTGGRGWPGLGLPNVDGAWGGVGASHVEQKAESELLEALRHSGEAGHSNEPPAGVEAAVPPQLAGRDIRELGARRKTPGLVEELEYEEILSGPQEDLEGLAEAALREFKRLNCSKYPVCEKADAEEPLGQCGEEPPGTGGGW